MHEGRSGKVSEVKIGIEELKFKIGGREFGEVEDKKMRQERRMEWDVVHQMLVESLSREITTHRCREQDRSGRAGSYRCNGWTEEDLLEFRRVVDGQLASRFGRSSGEGKTKRTSSSGETDSRPAPVDRRDKPERRRG